MRAMKLWRMRWAEHVASTGKVKNASNILVRKPEGKRPACKWEDNIKMDLKQSVQVWTVFM
jgi:hypothetical protein